MINSIYVDMLVNKIRIGENNPSTDEPFKVDDIKITEYKTAIESKLATQ